jgi:orotidine-5'-phosphate decarboxylase
MPHTWFLVPGFGSQGGTAKDVAPAFDQHGMGAIINSSRAIIFAHQQEEYQAIKQTDWQQAVDQATRDMIARLAEVR